MQKVRILNLDIDNGSISELLTDLRSGGIVFTPNVDHLIKLQKNSLFYHIYEIATHRPCDSQIMVYASRFLGTPIQQRISGSDLFPAFCDRYKDDDAIKIFLLGGMDGAADQAQARINARAGRNLVVGSCSPSYGFEKSAEECEQILSLIDESGANVLAVGLGAPKQEQWIYTYRSYLPQIKLFFAIGATIDFEAGIKQRAPKWMSDLGLEWLFRLLSEPKRLYRRYLIEDPSFLGLIVKQKLNLYRDPFAAAPKLVP